MATFDLKRVLAYSTISQLGLMFTALGIGTQQGWFASQFHLMSQGTFKALGFLAAGSVIHVLETRDMNQMGGLRKKMPLTFIAFTFSSFALAGIPPFIGFWSKDLILVSLLEKGNTTLFLLVLMVSVMTSFYTFRALFKVFIVRPAPGVKTKETHESPLVMTFPLIILSGAVLLLFISESPVANLLGAHPETSITMEILLFSLLAVFLGLVPAGFVYLRDGQKPTKLMARHPWLGHAQRILLAGYEIDQLYEAAIVRPAQLAATRIRRVQTGILGTNFWALMLFIVAILLVVLI